MARLERLVARRASETRIIINICMHALIGVRGQCLKNGALAQGPLHALAMVTATGPYSQARSR